MASLEVTINGREHRVEAPPEESLLSVLRNRLQLTGTKYGCGEGLCGACTVLMNGRAVRSCHTTMAQAAGQEIVTIEGLEQNGQLHPVQQAFLDQQAFQCAYCTPGMIVAAVGLLNADPNPSADEIVNRMNGNICRCGTYPRIVAAVQQAARTMPKRGRS
jgi:aerobic-type carbon monoxide dehydrogenase small subunit (CoxS/CutS family)